MNAHYSKTGAEAPARPREGRRELPEKTVKIQALQIERKTFVLALMENECGQFLRITEESSVRRNKIIIPAAGLEDFRQVLESLSTVAASHEVSSSNSIR